jgi:mono/diheme cytochrome c family protein
MRMAPNSVPGERDYMLYCGVCHGLDLKGNPDLQVPTAARTLINERRGPRSSSKRGKAKGRMPSYESMPEAKRVPPILDYVLSKGIAAKRRLAANQGDVRAGRC